MAATVDGSGRLSIVADDNSVALYVDRTMGDDVEGIRVRGDDGTTVNGQPIQTFAAVRALSFEMRGGNATLTISNVRLDGPVEVTLAEEANRVTVRRSRIQGGVAVRGGSGADAIELRDVAIRGDLEAGGAGGRDRFRLNRVTIAGVLDWGDRAGQSLVSIIKANVAGDVRIATGNSIDRVALDDSNFSGAAVIRVARGNDALDVRGTTFATSAVIDAGPGDDHIYRELTFDWSFAEDDAGWRSGFADYGAANPEAADPFGAYGMSAGIAPLPAPLDDQTNGFRFSASNRSDDLFMFLTRVLTRDDGVDPTARYRATFDVLLASGARAGSPGIGGSPAESVFVKVGGIGREPVVTPVPGKNFYTLNVNKGGNGVSPAGGHLSIAGDIANGDSPDGSSQYQSVGRTHTHPNEIRPRHDGKLWLIVGTDSGYEGQTVLYYQSIRVRLTPADA